ncbi:IclR family transcriptional regulator [Marinobacter sp.]|uniref:IclR family transcriptional regulator n=1 Tax=Marinobacter sp. TaxID=50741 RepID=UPI0026171394|nr:IclR family transcriptional regulator [Marinobacter sp.]
MTTEGEEQSKRIKLGIQSVETGYRVLNALMVAGGSCGLKTLSALAGMHPSKAHRYLASFMRVGLVEQDPDSGQYDLGRSALQIGMAALNRLEPVREVGKALRALVNEVDQTAMAAVWSERGPVLIQWVRSSRPVTVNIGVGSILPVLTSSSARVFLAHMPPKVLEETLRMALDQLEPWTVKRFDLERLRQQIDDVRRTDVARVEGTVAPGLRAVSVPVFDAQGETVVSMSFVATVETDVERFEGAVPRLQDVAARISERLGYQRKG